MSFADVVFRSAQLLGADHRTAQKKKIKKTTLTSFGQPTRLAHHCWALTLTFSLAAVTEQCYIARHSSARQAVLGMPSIRHWEKDKG